MQGKVVIVPDGIRTENYTNCRDAGNVVHTTDKIELVILATSKEESEDDEECGDEDRVKVEHHLHQCQRGCISRPCGVCVTEDVSAMLYTR